MLLPGREKARGEEEVRFLLSRPVQRDMSLKRARTACALRGGGPAMGRYSASPVTGPGRRIPALQSSRMSQ